MIALYGGAMCLALPSSDFIDASKLRQIPDHQEVWVSQSDPECSFVIELLQANEKSCL
jgi:Ran-interacting Mog1 protein